MRDPRFDNLPFILETPMLSGNFNTDKILNQANGSLALNGTASSSKVKLEAKNEEEAQDDHGHSHEDDADIEDNASGQPGGSATTWKREIDLLQELERVPFGQTNDTIDKLSSEIVAIVKAYRAVEEERQTAAKEAKDAVKEAKKAVQLAEKGVEPKVQKEKKPKKPRASKNEKAPKIEVKEKAKVEEEEEMELDSSEVDQLASDYEG